jgi:signal transduction histidine kinase
MLRPEFIRTYLLGSVLLLALCILPRSGAAQPAVDSLKRLLSRAGLPDTQRVRVLDELCWQLSGRDLPAARRYGAQGLALAQRRGYRHGQLICHNDLGTAATYAGDYVSATRHFLAVLKLAQQPGAYAARRFTSLACNGLGMVLTEQGDYPAAAARYVQALRLAPTPADSALYISNLANSYQRAHHADAEPRLLQALALYRRLADEVGQARCLANLGNLRNEQHRLPAARTALQQAYALHQRLNDGYNLAFDLLLLGTVEREADQLTLADSYLHRALAQSQRVGASNVLASVYEELAVLAAQRGDFRSAYHWQQRFHTQHDTLLNETRAEAVAAWQARFDASQREAQIRQLTQQAQVQRLRVEQQQSRLRTLLAALAGVLLALGFICLMAWKLRRSQRALAVAQASKDRLYAVVAHDLRSPVAALSGVASQLEYYLAQGDEARLRRLPTLVRHATEGVHTLLDNLLHWAASQTGELRPRPEQLPVAEVLAETVALYQSAAAAKDIDLRLAPLAAGLDVWADRNMLRTVLRNLTGNALKFTPRGGCVTLSARGHAEVTFEIADSGPGLSAPEVAALLSPDGTVPRRPGTAGESGTGLGWPLSRTLTEQQHGRLSLHSTPGVGTTVCLTLPAGRATRPRPGAEVG